MSKTPGHTVTDILGQTARISWAELEIHFARGVVIRLAPELDLVAVAACFANDEKSFVDQWIKQGQLQPLDRLTAKRWSRGKADLWAVVVAPWVLVQERE
jgi:hypothetical protein